MVYALSAFGILAIIGLWFLLYRARRAGEDRMAAKVTEKSAETMVKMDKAAAQSPKTRDELTGSLDKGEF